MGVIRDFIQQILYLAIVTIIIELILPKGNTKKYVYVILSLFMLLNIVSPVINIIRDIEMQEIYDNVLAKIKGSSKYEADNAVEVFSDYKNDKITQTIKTEMYKDIEEKLKNINVEMLDLKLELDNDYAFEKIDIAIGNIDHLGTKKSDKILDIMILLKNEYKIQDNVITITEEEE